LGFFNPDQTLNPAYRDIAPRGSTNLGIAPLASPAHLVLGLFVPHAASAWQPPRRLPPTASRVCCAQLPPGCNYRFQHLYTDRDIDTAARLGATVTSPPPPPCGCGARRPASELGAARTAGLRRSAAALLSTTRRSPDAGPCATARRDRHLFKPLYQRPTSRRSSRPRGPGCAGPSPCARRARIAVTICFQRGERYTTHGSLVVIERQFCWRFSPQRRPVAPDWDAC